MPPGIGYPNIPGLLAINDQTPPILRRMQPRSPQDLAVPVRDMPLGERLKEALFQVAGGANDPNLTIAQNREAQKRAMLQSGLATLAAANQPGASAGGALAQGLMFGQQVGEGERANIYASTQEERLRQALSDPETLAMLTPKQRRLVHLMPPTEATKFLAEVLMAPAPEAKVVGEGAALVGADGKPIFTNSRDPDPFESLPGEMKAALFAAGITSVDQLTPEQRQAVFAEAENYRRAGATNISVPVDARNISGRGMTESMVKMYDTQQNQAVEAEGRLQSLSVMEQMLDEGMTTGQLESMTAPLRSIGASLGVANAENLGRQELFRGLSNRIALEMKEGMTGPMSDRDILFLQEQAPQLANTVEGNRLLIEVLRRMAQRQIQIADIQDQFAAENEGSLAGWRRHRSEWLRDNPMDLSDLRGVTIDFED